MKIKKTIVIPIIFFLVGIGLVLAYNQGTQWVNRQKANSYNAGVITTTNQIYSQAITGQLLIRDFLFDEDGKLIIENGRAKQGEVIILIIE